MPASENSNAPALIYDALAYIDATQEDYDEYAAHLIEEEMKRLPPPLRQEQPPQVRFRSPLMQGEMKRVAAMNREAGNTQTPINIKKDPPLQAPTEDSIQAWQDAVRQAKISYEKERIRHMMLDISKDGSTAAEQWKQMNAHLESVKADLELSWQQQKSAVDTINLQRQKDQQQKGQELHVLSTHYANLIEKTRQLKQAVAQLKEELKHDAVRE